MDCCLKISISVDATRVVARSFAFKNIQESKTSRVHKVPNAFEISRFIMTIGSSASEADVKDGS